MNYTNRKIVLPLGYRTIATTARAWHRPPCAPAPQGAPTMAPSTNRVPEDTHQRALPINGTEHAPAAGTALPVHQISYMLDDFAITTTIAGNAESVKSYVARIRAIGGLPATPAARAAAADEKSRDMPVCDNDACNKYGQAMADSSRVPGTYYCQGSTGTKNGKPIYCKEVYPRK